VDLGAVPKPRENALFPRDEVAPKPGAPPREDVAPNAGAAEPRLVVEPNDGALDAAPNDVVDPNAGVAEPKGDDEPKPGCGA